MMIFEQIKGYFYMAVGFIIMAFLAVFKYRGVKIDKLEDEVKNHEAKDKAQDFEADNREAAAKAEAEDADNLTTGTFTV